MAIFELLLSQIRIKDILDILVVAFLLYQVLSIFHGTKAIQMLLGIFSLILLYAVSASFKLYSLNWLLEHFFNSFFIIVIILFQDQIRATLASFGTGKTILSFFNKKEKRHVEIEEVVEACGVLSREKVGALIVVEKNHGLLNYIETGTKIDSSVHSDLIYTLFQVNSPLHDGAIILKGSKIAAAGCFLPLSKNVEIDRHYGTRHRAALGISELTDAIVIVVSEERGNISICFNGVFYTLENERQLRKYLRHLWLGEKLDMKLKPINKTKQLTSNNR